MSNGNDRNVRKVTAFLGKDAYNDEEIIIRYADTRLLGNGSFGVVYQAKLVDTNEWVAIKKVLQDRRYKVRFFVFSMFFLYYFKIPSRYSY